MTEPSVSGSKPPPRGRKRAASTASPEKKPAKRRKAGRLEAVLKKLPLEVVFRIVGYLDPRTLINLSRSNQQFRETLLSSDLFWKTARLGAGMPDLEAQDITERQYILLVFDKNCHDCSQPNVQEINLVNCARLCSSCQFDTKVTEPQLRELLRSLHPMAQDCAKYTSDSGYRVPRGIHKLSKKLHTLQGAELDKFVAERELLKEIIERDSHKIKNWSSEQADNKYYEGEANRKSREESIKKNLLALGWTDLTLPQFWTSKSQVMQQRKLTPRIWKSIEAPLVKALRSDLISSRNNIRRGALIVQYKKLMQEDSQSDLFPSRATFFNMPSVKSVWEKNYGPDPPAVELDGFFPFVEAEWVAALAAIANDVTRYQQEMTDLAVKRLTDAYVASDLEVPDSPINDPRSYFRYKELDAGIDWEAPEVIVLRFPAIHRVMRDRQDGRGVVFREPTEAAEFKNVRTGGGGGTLNVELKDI